MNKYKTSYIFNQRLRSTYSFSYNNLMAFKYSHTTEDQYLYLMVGKKYGNAVHRNQLKRWIRFVYYETLQKCPGLGLMVRPIKPHLEFEDVRLCFQKLMLRLQDAVK